MQKILVICCLFLFSLSVSAQSNYILAGQTDSMIYTMCIAPPWSYDSEDNPECDISIDLNEDGITDLIAKYIDVTFPAGGAGIALSFITPQSCMVRCVADSTYGANYLVYEAASFSYHDTLASLPGDTWTTGNVLVYNRQLQAPCSMHNVTDCSYYSFKLLVGQDTLLAYVHALQGSFPTDWACQGPPLMDTIYRTDGLNEINKNNNLKVFPMPFNQQLIIQSPEFTRYFLYNASGYLILRGNQQQINTSSLAPGLYIIGVQVDSKIYYKKVIKAD